MMNLLKNTKMMGGAVVLVALLVLGYYYWGGSGSTPEPTLTQQDVSLSQDLLLTLNNLHAIKLDPSIFSDPLFQSLTDFGVTIPPQPTGRPNPFAPVGFTSAPSGP
jgi:hypothetical protein